VDDKIVIIGGKKAEFVGVYEILQGLHQREENGESVMYCPAERLPQLIDDNKGKRAVSTGGHLIHMTAEEVGFFRVHGRHRFRTVQCEKGWEMEQDSVDPRRDDFTRTGVTGVGDLMTVILKSTDPSLLELMARAERAEQGRVEVLDLIKYRLGMLRSEIAPIASGITMNSVV